MATNKTNSFSLFEQEQERANPMVASITSHLVSIRKKNIAASLSDFEGSAHKLEHVKTLNGIEFINDARSTNITSVWFALQNMTKPVVWIMNIDDTEKVTDDLVDTIREKVKCIVMQGVYNTEGYNFFASLDIPVFVEMNMEDAVRQAYYAGDNGYAVLFSPGVNGNAQMTYRERGNRFKSAVGQL